jgi:uncharacterized membrane protein YqgA involved in biofilm formation
MGLGTAVNVVAVLVGGGLGTLAGTRLPPGMRETAMQAIGLVTLLIGVANFLEFDNPLVPLVSVIVGLLIGEILKIDASLKRFGDYLQERFSKGQSPVSRAFVTTSLLFCVGPLTVLGSLEDGLTGDYGLLALRARLTSSPRSLSRRFWVGACCSRRGRCSWCRERSRSRRGSSKRS